MQRSASKIRSVLGFKAFFAAQSHFGPFWDSKAILLLKPILEKFYWFNLTNKKKILCFFFLSFSFQKPTSSSRFMKRKNFFFDLFFFSRKQNSNFLPQNQFQKKFIFALFFSKSHETTFKTRIYDAFESNPFPCLFFKKKCQDFPWKIFPINFKISSTWVLGDSIIQNWRKLSLQTMRRVKSPGKSFFEKRISQFLSPLKIRKVSIKRNRG